MRPQTKPTSTANSNPNQAQSGRRASSGIWRSPWALALLLAGALGAAACGGDPVKDDGINAAVKAKLESSSEVVSIDAKMTELEAQAAALKERSAAIEARVVAQLGPAVSEKFDQELGELQLLLEIDKNSVLRVNAVAMSQSEFQRYAQKRAKGLCQPQPVLFVDSKADYSVVSWVLETIYNQGCSGVDIQERSK